MVTDFQALDDLTPPPPQELFRQWVLSPDPGHLPAQWPRRTLHGWYLGAHPDAHVCELRARDGTALGWVMEPLARLTPEGGTLPVEHVDLDVTADASSEDLELALYGRDRDGYSGGHGLEGMWVAVVISGPAPHGTRRVYLGAIHSVVFSQQQRVVATSSNLVPGLERDVELSQAYDLLRTNAYFTFGLTAHKGVQRLLPNHHLDLDRFEATRHWPRRGFDQLDAGADGAAAIVDHSRRLLARLAEVHREYRVFLSAGRDSRAVLAMLRPLVTQRRIEVRLETTTGPDLGRRIDLQAAKRLADIAGLPHDVRSRQVHDASSIDVMRAFVRIGESKAGPALSSPGLKSGRRQGDDGFALAGMAGETARGYYWGPPDPRGRRTPPREVTPELLVDRAESPRMARTLAAAAAWLDSLPDAVRASSADTLDLAYVEQRLGCWESPSRYLWPGRPKVTSPMAAAYNIETMLRLPEDYRAQGRLQRDMVAYGWPELLTVPFNEATGSLATLVFARKLLHLPQAVRRRVRERRERV